MKVKELPLYIEPGTSIQNKTGSWRQDNKPLVTDDCAKCGSCVTYCPEGSIYAPFNIKKKIVKKLKSLEGIFPGGKEGFPLGEKPERDFPLIDYDYCKGCGICAEECRISKRFKKKGGNERDKRGIKMVQEGGENAEDSPEKSVFNENSVRGDYLERKAGFGEMLSPGHSTCAGCGNVLAMRYVLEGLSYSELNPIAVNATSCGEIATTIYPLSSWNIPWIHSLFENAPAVASGIAVGIELDKKKGRQKVPEKAIVFAGDGGTADIGLQSLSGMIERGHNILYIMLDNEAYMNTGIQRSSSTPLGAATTTSVGGSHILGKQERKKPMVEIIAAHGEVWSASASIADPIDVMAKAYYLYNNVKEPAFLQVHCPCPRGWRFPANETMKVAQSAIETGLWAQYVINNEGGVFLTKDLNPEDLADVRKYLQMQGRFRHLFSNEDGDEIVRMIREQARHGLEKIIRRSVNSEFKGNKGK